MRGCGIKSCGSTEIRYHSQIPGQFFEDDMVLPLQENREDLQAFLNIAAQEGEKLRVTFNVKKVRSW